MNLSESDLYVNTHISFECIGREIPGLHEIRVAWYANPEHAGTVGICMPKAVNGDEIVVSLADLQAVCRVAQLLEGSRDE